MNSNYDMDDDSYPSRKELAGARRDAEKDLRLWRRRALYSTVVLALSCGAAYPFLYGHSLYVYWDSFGKYLVILSTVLFIPFVICVGIATNAWFFLWRLKKGKL